MIEQGIVILFLSVMIFGIVGGIIGRHKGREVEGALWGIFLGPLGLIIILLLPEKEKAGQRQCPECLGKIPVAARRCQHCGVEQYQSAPVTRTKSSPKTYYVLNGEFTEGPFTTMELRQLIQLGKITRETQCAREGDKDWYPVGMVLDTSSLATA